MCDLLSGTRRRVPHGDTTPMSLSMAAHLLVIGAIGVPLLYVATELPEVPEVLAFVAAAPAPPPPPPPPPPPAASRPTTAVSRPIAATRPVPVAPPREILR
jgi:hypothetical protein